MKVAILGSGCVGLFVGAHLELDDSLEVHFIGRSVLRRAEEAGSLRITDFKFPNKLYRFATYKLNLHYDTHVLKDMDVILVCLKLGENDHLLKGINKDKTTLVFLQNGVSKFKNTSFRQVQGMIPFGVNELASGHFHKCTAGNLAFENTLPVEIVTSLRKSGLGVNLYSPSEFEAVKWFKLVINLGNALNAVVGRPLASCLRDRKYRTLLRLVWSEGLNVCKSAKIRLIGDINGRSIEFVLHVLSLPDCAYNTIAKIMRTTDENYKSSMLTDLKLKRNTEIDELNYRIVRMGEKYGVKTPTNLLLVKLIKDAEQSKSGSPFKEPSDLLLRLGHVDDEKSPIFVVITVVLMLIIIIYRSF